MTAIDQQSQHRARRAALDERVLLGAEDPPPCFTCQAMHATVGATTEPATFVTEWMTPAGYRAYQCARHVPPSAVTAWGADPGWPEVYITVAQARERRRRQLTPPPTSGGAGPADPRLADSWPVQAPRDPAFAALAPGRMRHPGRGASARDAVDGAGKAQADQFDGHAVEGGPIAHRALQIVRALARDSVAHEVGGANVVSVAGALRQQAIELLDSLAASGAAPTASAPSADNVWERFAQARMDCIDALHAKGMTAQDIAQECGGFTAERVGAILNRDRSLDWELPAVRLGPHWACANAADIARFGPPNGDSPPCPIDAGAQGVLALFCRPQDLDAVRRHGEGTVYVATGSKPFSDWIELVRATS